SKSYAKNFMTSCGIPTAEYKVFDSSQRVELENYIKTASYPIVIKADGLAAGKGVVIADDFSIATLTIADYMDRKIHGPSGERVVIEKFLTGTEASVFAVSDGENYVILPSSQDHKKIAEGETGKNTGGMGSYAPASKIVTSSVMDKVRKKIIEPVISNMRNSGEDYTGCLYAGLMIDESDEPYVIEFNTRFGDPETQSVLPLIKSDFLELLLSASAGKLKDYRLELSDSYACTVVLASEGYPDDYSTGFEITGLENISEDCVVFHAGTKMKDGKIVSSGGRVLNVTGVSDKSLHEAINIAYRNCKLINFENKYYRKDIGEKGL
ncbi:MAG: phosphoribosylamine--glycine ligase, partial [Ignavibacteria bacterium]|nr:phosphoribosylamine--glycine ligase [Ignavibacteria bacterium]